MTVSRLAQWPTEPRMSYLRATFIQECSRTLTTDLNPLPTSPTSTNLFDPPPLSLSTQPCQPVLGTQLYCLRFPRMHTNNGLPGSAHHCRWSIPCVLRMHFYAWQRVAQSPTTDGLTTHARATRWVYWLDEMLFRIFIYPSVDLNAWSSFPRLPGTTNLRAVLGFTSQNCSHAIHASVAQPIICEWMLSLIRQSSIAHSNQSGALAEFRQLRPLTLHVAL